MIDRRIFCLGFLTGTMTAALPSVAVAHTPYRQWVVYRRKHLMIGCHRNDDTGYALAKELAAYLVEHLPSSRARVARAPSAVRLAGLLATDQLDIAVLSRVDAMEMGNGDEGYESVGAVDLVYLADLTGGYFMMAHQRLNTDHAGLIAEAVGDWRTENRSG